MLSNPVNRKCNFLLLTDRNATRDTRGTKQEGEAASAARMVLKMKSGVVAGRNGMAMPSTDRRTCQRQMAETELKLKRAVTAECCLGGSRHRRSAGKLQTKELERR